MLLSSGLGPGPDEVGQIGLKLLHLWHHSQKIQNPKFYLFIADSKTCWVFWVFEQLSNAIGARAMDLQRHMLTAYSGPKSYQLHRW